jgi:hypothetical protein
MSVWRCYANYPLRHPIWLKLQVFAAITPKAYRSVEMKPFAADFRYADLTGSSGFRKCAQLIATPPDPKGGIQLYHLRVGYGSIDTAYLRGKRRSSSLLVL